MLRGITDDNLSERVLPNLANRYLNFSGTCRELPAFARQQDNRYRITSDFYSGLKKEIYNNNQVKNRHSIIKLFREKILLRKNLLEPGLETSINNENEKIQEFFNLLRKEINSCQYPWPQPASSCHYYFWTSACRDRAGEPAIWAKPDPYLWWSNRGLYLAWSDLWIGQTDGIWSYGYRKAAASVCCLSW